MIRKFWMLWGVIALAGGTAAAQDARSVLQAAAAAMGATNLKSIQYSGTGYHSFLGQNYTPALTDSWPRFELKSYTRTVDYEARSAKEEFVRAQGTWPRRGGGAGFPIQGEQPQNAMVSGNYAWNMQGTNPTPQPAAAELRQLEIWLTPHGFLKAALASNDVKIAPLPDRAPTNAKIVTFTALGKYTVNGWISEQNTVMRVQTWTHNPVLGDMYNEMRYGNYQDFGGVKFPTRIHQSFGNPPHPGIDLDVKDVRANGSGAALTVPDAVRQATVQPVRVEPQKLAEGVWYLAGSSHNSLAVEFRDWAVIIEGPLNEERSLAVIAETRKLIPNKPIRYVVNTHHHFDHAGGLRTYGAIGADIIMHDMNFDYYEGVVFDLRPWTVQPDLLSRFPRNVHYVRVKDRHTLSNGDRTVEIYHVPNLDHNGDMLVAYLPKEKILVEADLYTPPAPNAPAPARPNPNHIGLYHFLKEQRMDVAQIAPIHGRVVPMAEFTKLFDNLE